MFDPETDGADVVETGAQFVADETGLIQAVRALETATLFLDRPDGYDARLNVLRVRDDEWVLVFSSMQRLIKARGLCRWMALTGEDLMSNLPAGVSLAVDVQDPHGFYVPASMMMARSWSRAAAQEHGGST